MAIDGVWAAGDDGRPQFQILLAPGDEEIQRLAASLAERIPKFLQRRGLGPESDLEESDPLTRDQPWLAGLYAASVSGRVAFGSNAGRRVSRIGDEIDPESIDALAGSRCASVGGFSLHANVAVHAGDRQGLGRLIRYCARPPIARHNAPRRRHSRHAACLLNLLSSRCCCPLKLRPQSQFTDMGIIRMMRKTGLLFILLALPITVWSQSTLNFPRSFSPSDLTTTGFAVVNPGASAVQVTFTMYSAAGATVASSSQTIPGGGQLSKLGSDLFPSAAIAGWVQASSSTTGLQGFWLGGDFATYTDGGAAANSAASQIFPLIAGQAELSIANTSSASNTLTFKIYRADGTTLAPAATQVVAVNGVFQTQASALFSIDISAANTIVVTGTAAFAGTSVIGGFLVNKDTAVVNAVDTTSTLTTLNFPHAVSGPLGNSNYTTSVGVTNLASTSQSVTLTFNPDPTGSPVVVQRTLPPLGSLRDTAQNLFSFTSGFHNGWIQVSGTQPITGFVAYGDTSAGGLAAVPVQPAPQSSMLFAHIAGAPTWYTGLALLNASSTAANVEVYAMTPTGTLIGGATNVTTAAFTLGAGKKTAKLLSDLIPATASQNGGFVFVRTTNNVPLYGIELFGSLNGQILSNVAAGALASGITYTPPSPSFMVTAPSTSISLRPGVRASLSASFDGTPAGNVHWTIAEGADGGTINDAGVYTAPSRMGTYHVTVTSLSDPTKMATALITVRDTVRIGTDVVLDFSQTQFEYQINADTFSFGPMVIFNANNTSATDQDIHVGATCYGYTANTPVTQLRETVTKPGDSVFFKYQIQNSWCQNLNQGGTGGDYPIGTTVQRVDFTVTVRSGGSVRTAAIPMRIVVSRQTASNDLSIPPGDVRIEVHLQDANGRPVPGQTVSIATEYAFQSRFTDQFGTIVFNVAKAPGYWLWETGPNTRSTSVFVDGNNVQPFYTVTLIGRSTLTASASLLGTVKGRIGFWRASATADGTKILMANGQENWRDPSLNSLSKLYLLDIQAASVIWSVPIGGQSWSSDLSSDGRFAVVANAGTETGLPANQRPFVRLINTKDGSTIWTKALDTLDVAPQCASDPSFASLGVKFSHDANFIFVGLDGCDYSYLLNRSDASIRWKIAIHRSNREILFSADDRFIYIAPGDGYARKISTADGTEIWRRFVGSFAYVNGLDLSPDENYLCTGTKSGDGTVLNTATGAVIIQIHHGMWVMTCRFSPDSKMVVLSDEQGARLYDIASQQILWYRPIGNPDHRFSPDGRWIMSTVYSRTAIYDIQGNHIFDVSNHGFDQGIITDYVGFLNPQGTRYVFASRDFDPTHGDGDVIQIYNIQVSSP